MKTKVRMHFGICAKVNQAVSNSIEEYKMNNDDAAL